MAFEPNFEKVVASVRKKIGTVQTQVEYKFPVSEEVSKILCSNAKANIVSAEANGKEIIYTGFVNFQVIYIDKEQNPTSVDYSLEFKDRYVANEELVSCVPVVSISVIDVATSVSGDIRSVATLEVCIECIKSEAHNVLVNVIGDNYQVKTETLRYSRFVGLASNKFELNNDIEIKDGVKKVLSVCPSVIVEKISTFDRYLVVNGNVYFEVCYLTDNNMIRNTQSSFEFAQEVAQDDLEENSAIQNNMQTLYNDMRVTTNVDTDSAVVNVELPLLYQGYIFENISLDAVCDLYSTNNFTSICVESLESINHFDSLVYTEKLNGSLTIQDNDAFIDELLGVCCSSVVVANTMLNDGRLIVEGVATIGVIYLNKENNMVYPVEIEIPFALHKNLDLKFDENTPVKLSLTNIATRVRRGKEIEASVNLEVYTDIYGIDKNAVITKVEEEDEIPENECAMSFYLTKDGDTLWEISKELRISTETLLKQNPNLHEPMEAGVKVVVYRQRQVEF